MVAENYTIVYACEHRLDNGGAERIVAADRPNCRLKDFNIADEGEEEDRDRDNEGRREEQDNEVAAEVEGEREQLRPSFTDTSVENPSSKSQIAQTPTKLQETSVPSSKERIQPKRKPSKGRPAVPGSREADVKPESSGDGEGEQLAMSPVSVGKKQRGG